MYDSLCAYRRSRTHKATAAVLRGLKTAYADSVLSAISDGRFADKLIAMPDPTQYCRSVDFAKDYLAYNLIRKLDCYPSGIDTAGVALRKFYESEERCKLINDHHGRDPSVTNLPEVKLTQTLEAIIHVARAKIGRVLGSFSWDDAYELMSFSGGASSRLRKESGAPFYKFQGIPEASRENSILGLCVIWHSPMWRQHMQDTVGSDPLSWVKPVVGSVFTTVPKSFDTDRGIAKEADLDMYCQKGIGSLIRRKLRTVGVDLNDQTHNQRLAKIGSGTGSLVTIDLQSASDSVSLSVVQALLPSDWVTALGQCRAASMQMPDRVHVLEKISSMGNGYTFELESLIFWALSASVLDCYECSDNRLGIYGDDIVIHNSVAEPLIRVLAYLGFQTNVDKTFLSGPFRESCGSHYFHDQDVTPFYVKEAIEHKNRFYWFLNSLRLWLARVGIYDAEWRATLRYLFKLLLPKHSDRRTVPPHFSSEAGLYVSSVEHSLCVYDLNHQQHRIHVWHPVRRKHRPNGRCAVLHWFNGRSPVSETEDYLYIEKGKHVYSLCKKYTSAWDDILIVYSSDAWQ